MNIIKYPSEGALNRGVLFFFIYMIERFVHRLILGINIISECFLRLGCTKMGKAFIIKTAILTVLLIFLVNVFF